MTIPWVDERAQEAEQLANAGHPIRQLSDRSEKKNKERRTSGPSVSDALLTCVNRTPREFMRCGAEALGFSAVCAAPAAGGGSGELGGDTVDAGVGGVNGGASPSGGGVLGSSSTEQC